VAPFGDQVRAIAAARPAAVAIDDRGATVSYDRLASTLDATVLRLRRHGLGAGDVVALHAERTARLPVDLLALWDLDVTVALLDAALPPARLAHCEQVTGAHWRLRAGEPARLPSGAGCWPGTSHVLFTSGTTGRPGAVRVGPGALVRTLAWYRETFAPATGDRVTMLGGLGHDPVLRDVLGALTSGATLVVPDPGQVRPDRLPDLLLASRTSVLHATPPLLEVLCGRAGLRLPDLRLVIAAGAVLRSGTVRRLRDCSGAAVFNAYGTTETPQIASCAPARPGDDDGAILPVGTGAGATTLRLSGGDRGEVVVRGPNLALGYVAGTGPAGRFTPGTGPQEREFRTGDVGERDPHGSIRIVGRLDRQLDLNGHRIAPEEIESAALVHPAVRQAAAGPLPSPTGLLLSLTVVPEPGSTVDVRSLRAHLRALLPEHAVPARVRVAPRLELTDNHKVTPGPG
jgi:acyl-coenzyme A synthetase/AMP-(fatty) acid ligase